MASANLCAASPQLVSGLTRSDILNSQSAKSRVGIVPSTTIRRNVGMLIRTLKDFLNAATISRKQDIAITKVIFIFRSNHAGSTNPARHDLRAVRCRSQHRFCCAWSAFGTKRTFRGPLLGVKRTRLRLAHKQNQFSICTGPDSDLELAAGKWS